MQQLRQELARSTPHEAVHRQRMGIFDLDLLSYIFWKSSGISIINSEKGQTVTRALYFRKPSHIYGNSTWHDMIIKMILNVQFTNCFLKKAIHPSCAVTWHSHFYAYKFAHIFYIKKRFFEKIGKAAELQ